MLWLWLIIIVVDVRDVGISSATLKIGNVSSLSYQTFRISI